MANAGGIIEHQRSEEWKPEKEEIEERRPDPGPRPGQAGEQRMEWREWWKELKGKKGANENGKRKY